MGKTVATRLGADQAAALESYAAAHGVTPAAALRAAAGKLADAQGLRDLELAGLLEALDGLGLTGALAASRELLGRVSGLRGEAAAEGLAALAARDAKVAGLAAGTSTAAEAAAAAVAAGVWSAGSPGEAVVREAVRMLRARSAAAARAELPAVHADLARLAGAAVDDAVAAGGKLLDCERVARMLASPPALRQVRSKPVIPGRAIPWAAYGPGQLENPWSDNPPALPVLDPAVIAADPGTGAAWAEACTATAAYKRVRATARLVAQAGGPRSDGLAVKPDPSALGAIELLLPEPVHLAVFAAMGWQPGLHAVRGRGRGR